MVKCKVYYTLLLLLVSIVLYTSFSSALLTDGLVSYYSFDSNTTNLLDLTNNGLNGTFINSSNLTTGILSNSYHFNAPNKQAVNLTNDTRFQPTQNISISLWFNTTSGSVSEEYLIRKRTSGYALWLQDGRINAFTINASQQLITNYTTRVNNSVWHHVVMTRNTTTLALYVDGVLQNSTPTGGALVYGSGGVAFGRDGDSSANFYTGKIDEAGIWNRSITSVEVTQLYNSGSAFSPFTSSSIASGLISPSTGFITVSSNITLFSNVSVNNVSIRNSTYFLYYSNVLLNTTSVALLGNVSNSSNMTFYSLSNGSYLWNVYSCGINNTGVACAFASSNFSFNVSNFVTNNAIYNGSTFETKTESFGANFSVYAGSVPILGKLIYNGSVYSSATITNLSSDTYLISRSIDVPLGVGFVNFSFNFTIGSVEYSTPLYSQQVNITLFQSTFGSANLGLNISFLDENSLAVINASVPSSTFTYYLGSGAVNKTLSFINNSDNYFYSFNLSTGSLPLYVVPNFQYRRVSDYPQRIWTPGVITYNNTLTQQTLYLLNTNDGIFVTYQVVNSVNTVISGVTVVSTRAVGSSTIQVGAGVTDSGGLVTFWENPDFEHTVTFDKTGYDQFIYEHFPTQASYTITLGLTSNVSVSCSLGITQTVLPSNSFLYRGVLYNFNYTIDTSYWNLTSFQFTLTNSTGSSLGSTSSTSATGGTLSLNNINFTSSPSVIMTYVYLVSSSDCSQVSGVKVWVTQTTSGTEYSIWQLLQDFDSYTTAGLFGFDDFGRILLSIMIIIFSVGMTSSRYGIASEGAIMGILFGIVFFLDVGIGFIPTITVGSFTAVQYFPTILTFIILFVIIIREENR